MKFSAEPVVTSSWEQAGREAACPGEAVTFTCTAQETAYIVWEFYSQTTSWRSGDIRYEARLVKHRDTFTGTLTSVVQNGDTYTMTANLSTMANSNYNGSTVKCTASSPNSILHVLSIAGDIYIATLLQHTTLYSLSTGRPSPPAMFRSTRTQRCNYTEVTFSWEPPEYSGHATIDSYTLTVNGNNPFLLPHQISYTLSLPQATHHAQVSATNCVDTSALAHLTIMLGEC